MQIKLQKTRFPAFSLVSTLTFIKGCFEPAEEKKIMCGCADVQMCEFKNTEFSIIYLTAAYRNSHICIFAHPHICTLSFIALR